MINLQEIGKDIEWKEKWQPRDLKHLLSLSFSSFFSVFLLSVENFCAVRPSDGEITHAVELNGKDGEGFVDLCQGRNDLGQGQNDGSSENVDRKFETITLDDEILRYRTETAKTKTKTNYFLSLKKSFQFILWLTDLLIVFITKKFFCCCKNVSSHN